MLGKAVEEAIKDPRHNKKILNIKPKKKAKKSKAHESDEVKKDPIIQLGFGIVAYRDMLWTMIFMFSLFSLIMYPAISYYGEGEGYGDTLAELMKNEQYSLGNLGYSQVLCNYIPVSVGKN